MSRGEKGAVMRWVGVHIKAKRRRGRLRDGGASKENMCFFPGEGFKGVGGFEVFILWESFGFLQYTREGVRKDRLQQRVRSSSGRAGVNGRARKHAEARAWIGRISMNGRAQGWRVAG